MEWLLGWLSQIVPEWPTVHLQGLLFRHLNTAILCLVVLLAIAVSILAARAAIDARRPRSIPVPAVIGVLPGARWSLVRHAALIPYLAGLGCLIVAIADPYRPLVGQHVFERGLRIAIVIDASSSMGLRFPTNALNRHAAPQGVFFESVAAAELFVKLRMTRGYRDVIALIEFANEPYVIAPFTSDYDHILLSTSLISDEAEFSRFPSAGTRIITAIEQTLGLFKAFDFVEAAGNVIVIFSDGRDAQITTARDRRVGKVIADSVRARVPIYFVRSVYSRDFGESAGDDVWSTVATETGGHFYAASDEAHIVRAVHEIDRLSPGTIHVQRYAASVPEFSAFAMWAMALWTLAIVLKLTIPYFRTFP